MCPAQAQRPAWGKPWRRPRGSDRSSKPTETPRPRSTAWQTRPRRFTRAGPGRGGGISRVAAARADAPIEDAEGDSGGALRGTIEPVRPTPSYLLWIVIVAAVMVLLPLLYVAFVGMLGVLVLLHAVYGVLFGEGSRQGRVLVLFWPVGRWGGRAGVFAEALLAQPAKQAKTQALIRQSSRSCSPSWTESARR